MGDGILVAQLVPLSKADIKKIKKEEVEANKWKEVPGPKKLESFEDFNEIAEWQKFKKIGHVQGYRTLGLPSGYWYVYNSLLFLNDKKGAIHVKSSRMSNFDGFGVDNLAVDTRGCAYLEFDIKILPDNNSRGIRLEIYDANYNNHQFNLPIRNNRIKNGVYVKGQVKVRNGHVWVKLPKLDGEEVDKIQFVIPAGNKIDVIVDNVGFTRVSASALAKGKPVKDIKNFKNPVLSRIAPFAYTKSIGNLPDLKDIKSTRLTPQATLTVGGQGVPVGGIGAGTIKMLPDGRFKIWHNNLGIHNVSDTPGNGFAVYMEQGNKKITRILKTPGRQETLSALSGNYPLGAGTYYGQYPLSGFAFTDKKMPLRLSMVQFSPVVPKLKEASYPLAVYVFTAHNPTSKPVKLSLMPFMSNMVGWDIQKSKWENSKGNINFVKKEKTSGGEMTGIVFSNKNVEKGKLRGEMDGQYVLATLSPPSTKTSYEAEFNLNGKGEDLLGQFKDDGILDNRDRNLTGTKDKGYGAALASTITVQPGQKVKIPFVLVWDLPITELGGGWKGPRYFKRYTKYEGTSGKAAWRMAKHALANYQVWLNKIKSWQRNILQRKDLPSYYKRAIFNELYNIADASFWTKKGNFATMECYDYQFTHSWDVEYYGQIAVSMNFPEAAKQITKKFNDTIAQERKVGGRTVKKRGAVPHDIGSPNLDIWNTPNAYKLRDANNWRDLNFKHVLAVWREYYVTGGKDLEFLKHCYSNLKLAMEYVRQWDVDGDFIPEHDPNQPDQTYDQITLKGTSAYIGGLALGAYKTMAEMAKRLGNKADQLKFERRFQLARKSFEKNLWNGKYYAAYYDPTNEKKNPNVMADALSGIGAAKMLGLGDLLPKDRILKTLKRIHYATVSKVKQGKIGAMNLRGPNGEKVPGGQQNEVWTGTSYMLSAYMLAMGMKKEAWNIVKGISDTTYKRGLAYQTPEAWDVQGRVRSPIYTRAKAIWWIQWVLDSKK